MTTDTTYNGWTNYETWNVNLWITNDEASDWRLRSILEDYDDDSDAADALKDWIADDNPLAEDASLYTDLLGAALQDVNWREIVENHRDD